MKKRLITIILALVIIFAMATPAMAASVDDIVNRLNAIAAERQVTQATQNAIAEAIVWLRANPGNVAGNEAAIISAINDAANVAQGVPAANLSQAQLNSIYAHFVRGANLAGLTVTVDMATLTAQLAAGTLDPVDLIQSVSFPRRDGVAAPPDTVIRQTGFTADYSILIIVASVLTILFTAAIVTSFKLRVRHDVA